MLRCAYFQKGCTVVGPTSAVRGADLLDNAIHAAPLSAAAGREENTLPLAAKAAAGPRNAAALLPAGKPLPKCQTRGDSCLHRLLSGFGDPFTNPSIDFLRDEAFRFRS